MMRWLEWPLRLIPTAAWRELREGAGGKDPGACGRLLGSTGRRRVTVLRNGRMYAQYHMPGDPYAFGAQTAVLIGPRHLGNQDHFVGHIRDARIYARALDQASIAAWREHAEHLAAQRLGRERWYSHYELRIARVERVYSGPEGRERA